VIAKYTVQALLLYSLNVKFSTGKREKLYANFTFCFSFCGTASPRPPSNQSIIYTLWWNSLQAEHHVVALLASVIAVDLCWCELCRLSQFTSTTIRWKCFDSRWQEILRVQQWWMPSS